MYEIVEHTADIGFRIQSEDLGGLLADAGRALLSLVVANPESVQVVSYRMICIEQPQPDYLLFDWLSELLYLFEVEGLLLSHFDVQVTAGQLRAQCGGEPVDRQRHQLDHEVKAITYHRLRVEQIEQVWQAEVIVDI